MPRSFFSIVLYSIMVCSFRCGTNTSETHDGSLYTIEIRYEDSFNRKFRDSWNQMVSSDSLYLFLERGFKNDVITLYINGEKLYESKITTDTQDGSAGQFVVGDIQSINQLSLRLNNGPLVFFDQRFNKNNLLTLNYDLLNNKIELSVIDNVPFYD